MRPLGDGNTRASLVFVVLASLLLACGTNQKHFSIPICDAAGACYCFIPGFTICGHVCVNTSFDHGNCGSCGKTCDSGEVCSAGSCGSSCGNANQCGDRCQYDTSPFDCGSCGKECDDACVSGSCSTAIPPDMACPQGLTYCGGSCVDTAHDQNNCGGCGLKCGEESTCFIEGGVGMCCPLNEELCGGACVDTQTDQDNCGGCNNPCDNETICSNGFCQ